MMKVKANISFAGLVTMGAGEVRDISDDVAKDLIKAGHVVEIKKATAPVKKTVKKGDK